MTRSELSREYREWMYQLVYNGKYTKKLSYLKLLGHLHSVEFIYILGMDSNRAEDGIDFRYRFGYERNYPDSLIASYLDDRPCSMLEMMIALAHRCETQIMDDPEVGDRTGLWFWNMIVSLRLNHMTDANYNVREVDDILDRFMHREYDYDGRGGLFTIENIDKDMRQAEIWHQMNWYLVNYIDE